MPFPANWLEELVVEWLDLLGFTTSTGVFISTSAGGRWAPDVVGAKLDAGRLTIRHVEATMWIADGAESAGNRFRKKFSEPVQNEVRRYFRRVFDMHLVQQAEYQKWVVTCGKPSAAVQVALKGAVPDIQIYGFKDFVAMVLLTINESKRTPSAMLPSDKWLLHMIDQFRRDQLLSVSGAGG
jgi:hypothetical protein